MLDGTRLSPGCFPAMTVTLPDAPATMRKSEVSLSLTSLAGRLPRPPATSGVQFQASQTQGSVRLKLGEVVQIIRAGARTARLSIKKLETSKSK